jgi:ribonuclease HII
MAYDYLVGVDEVGRGPLAGPVAVGAFAVAESLKSKVQRLLRGIRDSKKLSEKQREEWFLCFSEAQEAGFLNFTVSFVGPKQIDRLGINKAIQLGLARALRRLAQPDNTSLVLLDGGLYAPKRFVYQKTLVGGDARKPIIAAASIVAKVLRDRRMVRYAQKFPEYGFERHKGYGTAEHLRMLRRHGLSPLHRRTFCGFDSTG